MCIFYKINEVVTQSPFEAARNEVAAFEVIQAEITHNESDNISRRLITIENTVSSNF